MGILDSKTKIFDTILTLEGRKQIATGKLQAKFYSFTDVGSFYKQDTSVVSGALDGTKRIFLEASSLPQDSITFEADDAGKLVKFPGSSTIVRNGQVLLEVTSSATTGKVYTPAQDNVFASMANTLLSSSLDSFKNCYIIGSPDIFNENRDSFKIRPNSFEFQITDKYPISYTSEIYQGNVETTDALFQDKRLSHLPNFQYLPPVNKQRPGDATVNLLGNYPNLNQSQQLTFKDVQDEISWAVERGFSMDLTFEETSAQNNLFCQIFEIGNQEIIKLDVIDFGLFSMNVKDLSESERRKIELQGVLGTVNVTKHVFFAGKIFQDSQGVHKFINLFTIIFE